MGTLITTPGTHSAFHCPGVGGKEMTSTGEQAWMLGSGLYLAGMVQVCMLDPILSGSASGISLPEAAVRLIGEPQPVHLCTSCPRRVPTAWHCPGHRFLMSYSAHAWELSRASSFPVEWGEEQLDRVFGAAQTTSLWL